MYLEVVTSLPVRSYSNILEKMVFYKKTTSGVDNTVERHTHIIQIEDLKNPSTILYSFEDSEILAIRTYDNDTKPEVLN